MLRNEIFEEMKKARMTSGLSQVEMADKIGISATRYSQMERRECISNIDNFIAWINGHGYDLRIERVE